MRQDETDRGEVGVGGGAAQATNSAATGSAVHRTGQISDSVGTRGTRGALVWALIGRAWPYSDDSKA
jgi:hypothetical protein